MPHNRTLRSYSPILNIVLQQRCDYPHNYEGIRAEKGRGVSYDLHAVSISGYGDQSLWGDAERGTFVKGNSPACADLTRRSI